MTSATYVQPTQVQGSSSNLFGGGDTLSLIQGNSAGLIRGFALLAAAPLLGLVFVIALPLVGLVAWPLAALVGVLKSILHRRTPC